MNCESGVFSVISTVYSPRALTDTISLAGAGQADAVHDLVLPSGGQAVDDVGRRQRLPVRPPRVVDEVQAQRAVAVRPRVAACEPRLRAGLAQGRDQERLVERALDERAARQTGAGKRVEVLDERRVTRAGHDEAAVSCRRRGSVDRGGCRRCVRTVATVAAPATTATATQRVVRSLRRIGCPPFSPGRSRAVCNRVSESVSGSVNTFSVEHRVKPFCPQIAGKMRPILVPERSGTCFNAAMAQVAPHRLTIRQIADLAGVSIATVSRVLNGRDDVAPETREARHASDPGERLHGEPQRPRPLGRPHRPRRRPRAPDLSRRTSRPSWPAP